MSSSAELTELPTEAEQYDGLGSVALAARLGIAVLHLFDQVGSALDVAHRIAPNSPPGTLVLADEQTAGRGRHGRRWASAPGAGIWLTLIERPGDMEALDVLSLRCGLLAAEALDPLAAATIGLKWPNDLYVHGRKLAGILIETRWRGSAPDWVAIGFGLNVAVPDVEGRTGLREGVARLDALAALVPALRRAAAATGPLRDDELTRWHSRDVARSRVIVSPAEGVAAGISPAGELLVRDASGRISPHRSGSLTFAEPLPCS